jgi:hypothetical protein
VIHVGAGFVAKERPHVVETLSTLAPHLGRWDPRDVEIDVSLQDRGGKEQRVTLRTSLPGLPPLVAVADNPDLTQALDDAKARADPSARTPEVGARTHEQPPAQERDDPESGPVRAARPARCRGQIERQS